MKKLNFEQMEKIEGGQPKFMTGLMCAVTVGLAFSVFLAPLAGATGVGCAVGLYAIHTWEANGINTDTM
jgi:hypothetical protein